MRMPILNQAEPKTPTEPQPPVESETDSPEHNRKANVENLEVIDKVFAVAGFEQCFWEAAGVKKPPHIKLTSENTPLVLHVDDDVDLVDALTARLKASGFRVASALDGVTGFQAALFHPADLVILDYDMPNGRGDLVIELLKGNPRTKNIPIVVLTAISKRGLKRELLAKGANLFMSKPFDFDELKSSVDQLLSQ